ncbi:3-dehydroquinate synthase [Anditalea andensis]|uniref:3-dehydroquinate synthase n=1 Tax=Anditalea andensis TaxID=1048983 RepID=A0A074KYC5_9BACT|nr:3-dehydroquinate synthase [Anditalea andensis]KEO74991.1 3-dehydroquinate synthase [Anditalea andensis]
MESIIFSTKISQNLERFLANTKHTKLGIIADSNTIRDCYPLISATLPEHHVFYFEAGEKHKNLTTCQNIWKWMTENDFDRQSVIINLGGGVTGDMGGFCASTYKRGMRFINIPTTLLSQVDASVGGKLGIDFMGFKNHLGVFTEPLAVIISQEFLPTLPTDEFRSGYAEVIKHGLIKNEHYFSCLKTTDWQNQAWTEIIEKSISIKKDIVEKDPKEEGLRKILNFGHTIGHAIESHYLDTPNHLLHGEAIAIGMLAEAYLSHSKMRMAKEDLTSITQTILEVFGIRYVAQSDFEAIASLCLQDKKNTGKIINCSLLKRIGECEYNIPISEEDILAALQYYHDLKHEPDTTTA